MNPIFIILGIVTFVILISYLNSISYQNPKRLENQPKTEKPSPEQISFANTVLQIISPNVENFDFVRYRTEISTYSTTIVYRKGKQYIKIYSTTYPTDYPYYYNIVLGEGDSEDVFEYDWNSIAVWAMARIIDPTASVVSYSFPYEDKVRPSVLIANADLINYGNTFLKGDLSIFYEARKAVNQKREPYKIHKSDGKGNYNVIDEPISAEKKKKYS
jgi:hypothetical protein